MTFGFVFTQAGLVVYDVCRELIDGKEAFVACLSADPAVRFADARAETAVSRLLAHVGRGQVGPVGW